MLDLTADKSTGEPAMQMFEINEPFTSDSK